MISSSGAFILRRPTRCTFIRETSMRLLAFKTALILAVSLGSGVAPAEELSKPAPQQSPEFKFAGEEFYYSARLNNVEAMRIAVRAGDIKYKDKVAYVPISGSAQSTGFFHSIYPINDQANTFLNPQTYRPLRSEKYFDEKGDVRTYKVDFVHSTYRARVERERNDTQRRFQMAIPGTTHDMISWFYELRTREDFELGRQMTFYIYDGWKLSALRAKVVAKEDVYTPMGWFKAWRVDFERDVLNSRGQRDKEPILKVRTQRQSTASLWVSRDENRLPIKVAVSTPLGNAEAVLIKMKLASD
ncbi:DUF3108 domain-containing protein [Microvenator marinus]|uniref:DUF3108 domain-containing protein n=2 Tax=Microvenator marinus TaxID=2600177 RepID=A0A5B8XL43_9DELT|nr:DUF3108 domain-containing protein [Microvenator marinus]